jgi:hypothetical protein
MTMATSLATNAEAQEAQRLLALIKCHPNQRIAMYSNNVDMLWHNRHAERVSLLILLKDASHRVFVVHLSRASAYILRR